MAVLLALLVLAVASVAGAAASAAKPNFVVLFGDDWGYGDMGANWPAAKGFTPNLDRIASEGIRFTDFHVGASVCSVSRAALLTGRLGLRNGVVHNFDETSKFGLPTTEITISSLLKGAGYRTGMIGKWHLGTTPNYSPTYRGFDTWLGLPYSVDMGCTDQEWYDLPSLGTCPRKGNTSELAIPLYLSVSPNCSGQQTGTCNGDIIEQPANYTTLSSRYGQFAQNFISKVQNDSSPFFLYVPFAHMHVPQFFNPEWAGRSGRGVFYDTLMEFDNTVGMIMQALKDNGVDENTLVFVTGDNGPWEVKCNLTGSKGPFEGLWQKKQGGGGSSAKMTLWEAGHREVGLARWPGKITPRVSNALVSSLDYLPTLLSLAGVPLPTDRAYDGIDISNILLEGSDDAHDHLFHPNSGASGPDGQLDAVRWKQYKAIYQTGGAPDCSGSKGLVQRHDPPLLFDLSVDPAEETALNTSLPQYQAVVQQIAALLDAQMHSVNTTMRSVVDYADDPQDEPCCNRALTACRCKPYPGL